MVCCEEVRELRAQMVVAVVVEALHSRVLGGAVHPLDLTIGPWMVGLGLPLASPIMLKRIGGEGGAD